MKNDSKSSAELIRYNLVLLLFCDSVGRTKRYRLMNRLFPSANVTNHQNAFKILTSDLPGKL